MNFIEDRFSGKRCLILVLILMAGLWSGCAIKDAHKVSDLDSSAKWVLLPILNFADAPQSGERVEAILNTLLRAHGVRSLSKYPDLTNPEDALSMDERQRYDMALDWARQQGFRYGVTGTVEEWRYKSGLDGEPAVGISIRAVDVATGEVLWSASGARSGWGRESVSATGQKLLRQLVGELPLTELESGS